MGCGASADASALRPTSTATRRFRPIPDRFTNINQVQAAVREAGLESSNLILGIDFTKSNTWTGKETFHGRNLHDTTHSRNPYQEVIKILGTTLEEFDDDKLIPCYGFGDVSTGNKACFAFNADGKPCHGVSGALQRYKEVAESVQLAGPTCFAPLIYQAIDIVCREQAYHILVIVADGQVTDASPEGETAKAIIEASNYPLSIIVVGVGDGPWHAMEHYDDKLPQRRFDNFQFVDFHQECAKVRSGPSPKPASILEARFALAALMEIPDQYTFVKEAGLLNSKQLSREPLLMPTVVPGPPEISVVSPVAVEPTLAFPPLGKRVAAPLAAPPSYSFTPAIAQGHAAPAAEW